MVLINRNKYMDSLKNFKDKEVIKIISGIRRCGKSTLMDIYRNWLLESGVAAQRIIYINFEDIEYEHLQDYRKLHDYILPLLAPEKMNYIFLDEIQNVVQFEKVVDSLFIKKNVDMYITGSNAYFMSGELATLLTGRYIEIKMLPLSFSEYCEGLSYYASGRQLSKIEKYALYQKGSSFPYALQLLDQEKEMRNYLEGLYNSILLKDIAARLKISDVMMMESVVRFVFHNIGNLLSTTKIANTMTTAGRKIDQKTVEKYLKGLTDSLMVYQVNRYNIKGKQLLTTLEKYYLADIGLRQYLLGSNNNDQGYILENIIYLELLRRGNEVYVGYLADGEVDFVTMNAGETSYYQVALTVLDTNTMQRELSPLNKINDHYPKILLTLDEIGTGTIANGIKHINALDWLLDN